MENKMNIKRRRKYDRDFKRNAVLMCDEPGRIIARIAQNLGIPNNLLYRWRREYHFPNGELAFPGNGIEALTEEQKQIRELTKRLRETEMERDILKKAMAIFSRAPK
jgi:transposase